MLELLDSGFEVAEVLVPTAGRGGVLDELRHRSERDGVRVISTPRAEMDRIAPGVKHQGVAARYRFPDFVPLERLIDRSLRSGPLPVVILDGVVDPHNLGAIVRSAEVFGSGGVVVRKHRAATITPAAVKASSGAVFRIPITETAGIDRAIGMLKASGYWVFGLAAEGEASIWETDISGAAAFVFGSESKGMSRLTRERCDRVLFIPQRGKVASLNVSATAAVVLAEWLRRSSSG